MTDKPWSLWDMSGFVNELLSKHTVANDSDVFWEKFDPGLLEMMDWFDAEVTYYEYVTPIFVGWFAEAYEFGHHSMLENRLSYLGQICDFLYEKSHGNLKYTYRMGFDPLTGKQVAVEFLLEPDKITSVGDSQQTYRLSKELGRSDSREDVDNLHFTALDKVKAIIRGSGHIDHITKALTVSRIFDSYHRGMTSVKMIPLIPAVRNIGLPCLKDMGKEGTTEVLDGYLLNRDFQNRFVQKAKTYLGDIENYHVSRNNSEGEKQGNGKYKSTKLFWGIGKFASNQFSPSIRGFIQKNKDFVPSDREKMTKLLDNYTGYNKPRRKSSQ